ncbi:MAG: tetratricopeptide repeat protein [Microcoleus sp. SU_5_6]|nr:tetratricopeptide repeat protein [Microcoleus sp. SU_5_6]
MQNQRGRHLSWKKCKENARLLVKALHILIDGDLDKFKDCDCLKKNIDIDWEGTNLWVKKTRLRDLAELTQKCGRKLETEEIRDAIHGLKKLEILEDKRGANNSKTITGSDKWCFMLKLPHIDKQENLDWLFGIENKQGEWERRRNEKPNSDKPTQAKQTELAEFASTITAGEASNYNATKNLGEFNQETPPDLATFTNSITSQAASDRVTNKGAIAANNRGIQLKKESEFVEARKQFELAIKLNPDNAASYYNLAEMYEDAEQFDSAIKLYRDAAFRGFAAAYCKLARLYVIEYKDWTKAVEKSRLGLQLIENERVEDDRILKSVSIVKSALLIYQAWAWKEQGRWQEALAKLQAAVKLESDRGLTYGIMAEVLENLGKKAEALAAWKNCLAYARSEERDEDIWIGKARQRLG